MAEADFRLMTEATGQRIAAALEALHLATVTGVKGDTEQNYRHGDVNLTPANIGAVAKSGDTMTGALTVSQIYSTNAAYPAYVFANTQNAQVADIYYDIDSKNFVFRYTPDGQEEHYALPVSTGSGGHYILTDKSPVLVTQGGTGATTAEGARTNIGYGCPSGSFVSADGKTITVTNGFITSIS